ncbi:type VI secretion system tip protein TssI/VgrG [Sorangium sp. So ce119]|uniref:type VI secretion system Vgr family protein n=1 Tax=Sorangium sp. So ce119 TaxID=3133279 RepID=UPI003F5F2A7F
MPQDDTSLHQVFFAAPGLDAGIARVHAFAAREGLSSPFVIEVDIELQGGEGDPASWLLQDAILSVVRAADGEVLRRYHGPVTSVRERASREARQWISVTMEGALARLRLISDYRIFQSKATRAIVEELLSEAGVDASRVEFRLSGATPEREVCTQFGETSFDFMSRILEEDGLFYFSEFDDGGERIVFADASAAWGAAVVEEIPFRPDSGLVSEGAVTALSAWERVRPARVTLRDHDFKRPWLDLEAVAEGEAPLGREHYDYPGRYVDPDEGKRRAQLLLDALTSESSVVRGKGNAAALTPGHVVRVSDAPEPVADRDWVVGSMEQTFHDRPRTTLTNTFVLVPKDRSYRPPHRAPRPVAAGPQVATVTGAPNEEIHTDEFGRVKVFFPWDRRSTKDDKSSAWVRVGQMHTSGSIAIPRVGWEVIIDFEGGDPDRPFVVGRLYNARYSPPQALPEGKTRSSLQSLSTPGGGGQNEIRMDDAGGGEQFHIHAEKDLNANIANNMTEKVANNSTRRVGSNHKVTVGADDKLSVGAKYELVVGGSQTWKVGGSRTKSVSAAENVAITGARAVSIGGSHTTTSTRSVETSTPANLDETVGGSCVEAAALGVNFAVAGSCSVSVGGAKIEAVVTGKTETTIGALASTIGGAFISASGADVGTNTSGSKATTVGGAWAANAGGNVELSSDGNLTIDIGGALSLNAGQIVLSVGGSNVTIAGGAVTITSPEIKLKATGPQPELAAGVEDI